MVMIYYKKFDSQTPAPGCFLAQDDTKGHRLCTGADSRGTLVPTAGASPRRTTTHCGTLFIHALKISRHALDAGLFFCYNKANTKVERKARL